MMTNFHFLGAFAERRGGFALHSVSQHDSVKVSAFVFGGARARAPALAVAFDDWAGEFGPSQYYSLLGRAARLTVDKHANPGGAKGKKKKHTANEGSDTDDDDSEEDKVEARSEEIIETALSLLRLSCYCPDMLRQLMPALGRHAEKVNYLLKAEIISGVHRTMRLYFRVSGAEGGHGGAQGDDDDDGAFDAAKLLHATLGDYKGALRLYALSERVHGAHHVTSFNRGLCHRELGDPRTARTCMAASLALAGPGGYENANTWLRYLDTVEIPAFEEFSELESALDAATRAVRGEK